MSLVVQVTGSALIVAAFAASQAAGIGRSSRLCLAANVIGSLALAAGALLGSQWVSGLGGRLVRRVAL
jgi:hypothetical protein